MDYNLEAQILLLYMSSLPVFGVRILMPRYFGPFPVSAIITPVAYRLALPGYMGGIHDVFQVYFFWNRISLILKIGLHLVLFGYVELV
jgi:hypothetical protein